MEAFAGRYRLIDLIGTGGMGSVWRAWDLRRSMYVAAKVLGQHDAAALLRFVREQSLRIEHPHVIAPHGWAADDDKVVFAMDLVRGGSVATLLGDNGPLPVAYVAVLLDQLLNGLSAVHAARVVHRDVKPANLLLDVTGTGRPHLRLSDFGVAALLDEPRMTRQSTILGTPGYLAPEQLAGADPDPRQDLYAVGAVAVELLTGERPGTDGKLPALPDQAAALADFVTHLTANDPSARPDTALTAGRLLAATGTLPPHHATPWTTSPDSPEVFDQLPPLPPTWTPTGPNPSTPGTAAPALPAAASPAAAPPTAAPPTAAPPAAGELAVAAPLAPAVAAAEEPGPSGPVGSQPGAPSKPSAISAVGEPSGPSAPAAPVQLAPSEPSELSGLNGLSGPSGPSGPSGRGGAGGVRVRRGLWWVAGGCFVAAAGLLGSAVWLLVR